MKTTRMMMKTRKMRRRMRLPPPREEEEEREAVQATPLPPLQVPREAQLNPNNPSASNSKY